jgi:hypothetical protein
VGEANGGMDLISPFIPLSLARSSLYISFFFFFSFLSFHPVSCSSRTINIINAGPVSSHTVTHTGDFRGRDDFQCRATVETRSN